MRNIYFDDFDIGPQCEEYYEEKPELQDFPEKTSNIDVNTLFYTYLRLYPGKSDLIFSTIQSAVEHGEDPETALLDVL